MTQPDETPPNARAATPVISYDSNASRRSALAVTSLIMVACAIPLMFILVGFVLLPVGFFLGLLSLMYISRQPHRLSGKGLAVTSVVMAPIAFVLGLLLISVLFTDRHGRGTYSGSYCAANIRGIMQSCNIYAVDNSDTFPVIAQSIDISAAGARYNASSAAGTPTSVADNTITSMYAGTYSAAPVYQNLWILVLKNQVPPKQFLCKSDPAAVYISAPQTSAGNYAVTFTNDSSTVDLRRISYSVAYPFTRTGEVGGWWKAVTDSTLPLISDIAPLDGETSAGITIHTASISGSPKSYNSRNHGGDGQVVGYSDVHASFERRPDIGGDSDNIFTSGGTAGPTAAGAPVTIRGTILPIGTNSPPWDTVLIPVRDAAGATQ